MLHHSVAVGGQHLLLLKFLLTTLDYEAVWDSTFELRLIFDMADSVLWEGERSRRQDAAAALTDARAAARTPIVA